jgi:hypothetical protein
MTDAAALFPPTVPFTDTVLTFRRRLKDAGLSLAKAADRRACIAALAMGGLNERPYMDIDARSKNTAPIGKDSALRRTAALAFLLRHEAQHQASSPPLTAAEFVPLHLMVLGWLGDVDTADRKFHSATYRMIENAFNLYDRPFRAHLEGPSEGPGDLAFGRAILDVAGPLLDTGTAQKTLVTGSDLAAILVERSDAGAKGAMQQLDENGERRLWPWLMRAMAYETDPAWKQPESLRFVPRTTLRFCSSGGSHWDTALPTLTVNLAADRRAWAALVAVSRNAGEFRPDDHKNQSTPKFQRIWDFCTRLPFTGYLALPEDSQQDLKKVFPMLETHIVTHEHQQAIVQHATARPTPVRRPGLRRG